MNNKGFTLVEILAVIAIIAIVGTIAVPGVLSMIGTSKDKSYEIMVDNIRVAAENIYQEIDYYGSSTGSFKSIDSIKIYNAICTDEDDDKCKTSEAVKISTSGVMNINLQTLVGNGFLDGVSNNEIDNSLMSNKNKKLIREPYDNEDIGFCEITITKRKVTNSNKICYEIKAVAGDDEVVTENCPSDYKNVRGCN